MRCVLGVVAGAAVGYARMADKPAATLLHLGPGLALANLHTAKRAYSTVVNLVGDQATYHLEHDACEYILWCIDSVRENPILWTPQKSLCWTTGDSLCINVSFLLRRR